MPITATQVGQFKECGYTVAPCFFGAQEVQAMQKEALRWINDGVFRDVSTQPDLHQNYQLIPLYSHSALFHALSFAPKVVHAVRLLIGPPVIKILDQMFYKPAQRGMGTNWHTDNAYFELPNPMRGTAMWIAIHDANRANGTLKVIPSVFHEQFPHVRDPLSDHHIRTYLDDTNAIHCECRAGDVVFFCFGTPHATGANTTDRGRAGVGLHFVNGDAIGGAMKSRWQRFPVEDRQLYLKNLASPSNADADLLNFEVQVQRVLDSN